MKCKLQKGMDIMIYLIQPLGYQTPLKEIIQHFLKKKYPYKTFRIKQTYTPKDTGVNTYFIINDPDIRYWDGLYISKKIRQHEPQAFIILASTELDYTRFFRSHVGFLGVIDLKYPIQQDVENYIEDCILLSHKI